MIAAGIDLGGTKIEAQVFGADWNRLDSRRVATPATYDALVLALADQIDWVEARSPGLPIGVAAAGLVNPATGLALTSNLPATGRPFPADIAKAAGRSITYVNDCRAQILSEAAFGAARGASPALGFSIGTGLAGGIVVDGRLLHGLTGVGGEFGHFALPSVPMMAHGLPILRCGCGRLGCTETLISGPGLSRIVAHLLQREMTSQQIVELRGDDADIARCWAIWCELLVETLLTLCLIVDPAVVVLGGGLGRVAGLIDDLAPALQKAQLAGFGIPDLRIAEGGDASAARGAAYAAYQDKDANG